MGRKSEGFAASYLRKGTFHLKHKPKQKYTCYEEEMLQYTATKIGITILLMPKCNAKLAEEEIEYMWACSNKGAYQNLSLKEKKGKDNFNASVCHCLSEQIITVRLIRKYCLGLPNFLGIGSF